MACRTYSEKVKKEGDQSLRLVQRAVLHASAAKMQDHFQSLKLLTILKTAAEERQKKSLLLLSDLDNLLTQVSLLSLT